MQPTITTDNPLAPRWMRDSSTPEETPAGYRDEYFSYPMIFSVGALLFAQGLFITFNRDSDFVLRQIEPMAFQTGANNVPIGAFRFRDGYGNALSEDLILQEVHGPLFVELWLPAGSRFFLDFDNTQNAFVANVNVTLRGCKRYKL